MKAIKILGVFVILAMISVLLWYVGSRPRQISLESPDAQTIKVTLARAYSTMSLVGCNPDADVSLLDSVFIDTSDYRLSSTQHTAVAQVFGPQVAKKAGYLTTLKAHYLLTNEPRSAHQDASSTPQPYVYCPDPSSEPRLIYESISVSNRRAVVRYDDGAASQEAVLVLRNGQWFVSSIREIWVHF